jgi:SAM-dependent methyltransferase
MDDAAATGRPSALAPPSDPPTDANVESIRLQAEDHPLVEEGPARSPVEHCLRLMHLKAYDEATRYASDSDVLDVGCNTGYGTMRFVDTARRVVGVDVSGKAIEAAQARSVDGRPEFRVVDGLTLPFPDDAFDLVVAFQVIEHIQDPVPFLREVARVARPGATVLFTTPNAGTRLFPGMAPWNRFHVREFLAPELDTLLCQVFRAVRVRGMFGTPTLYETEIRRVDATRRQIRDAAQPKRAPAPPTAPRRTAPTPPAPLRVARAVLPGRVRVWLRRTLLGPPAKPASATATRENAAEPVAAEPIGAAPDLQPLSLERFLEFGVDDLFYADHDLDRAMDFMAVCRV